MRPPLLLTLPALAALAAGCDLDFSSDATHVTVATTGASTSVDICAGPSGLLSCNGDERFHVSMRGETQPAVLPWFSFGIQSAVFDGDGDGTEVTVSRDRDGAWARVTLPAGFSASASPVSGGAVLRWDPSGTPDPMHWETMTTCDSGTTFADGGDLDDDGEARVKLPRLETGCTRSLSLSRGHRGTVSPDFPHGSYIRAEQRRSLAVP